MPKIRWKPGYELPPIDIIDLHRVNSGPLVSWVIALSKI